jgi:hypothetical protein
MRHQEGPVTSNVAYRLDSFGGLGEGKGKGKGKWQWHRLGLYMADYG